MIPVRSPPVRIVQHQSLVPEPDNHPVILLLEKEAIQEINPILVDWNPKPVKHDAPNVGIMTDIDIDRVSSRRLKLLKGIIGYVPREII